MVGSKNGIVVLVLAMSLMWSMTIITAQPSSPGISSDCTNVLVTLSPCLNYITGNSSTPSSSCCSQLGNVVRSSPQCLCQVLNGGASGVAAGLNINQTQALTLPNACNVQTPPVSTCNNAAGSPAGSPFGSPTTPSDKAMERLSDAKKGAVDPIAHQAAMVKRKNELQNSKQERASSEASRPIQVLKIKGLPPFVKKRKESGSLSKEKESAAKKQRTDTTKAVSVASEGQKDNKKEKKKDEKRKEEKRERKEKRSKGSSSEGRSKRIHDRQASHISGGSVSKPKGDIPMGIPLVSDALVYARKGKSVDNTSSPSKGREDVLALLETGFPPSHKQRLRDYLTSVMPKFPLERVFDQSSADDREEPEEDEYHTIPTQSGKFSGETRADMLKEWTKHVPAGYPQSLRGYEEGHIGPIKAELANALIRLDGVNKAMARNRAENKQCIKLARHCDDYLMAELEQQELRHRDALDAMQTGLSAAKDTAAAALVRVDALLLEKENWEKEKTLAADLHRKEKEKLEKEIADLQVQLKSSNEEAEKWKKHTEEAAAKAEREYKALVEEAWGHVSGGTEFSYLDSFINWVIESKAAERNGTTPPPKPEVQFQEEEEDEGEEVGENGDSSSSSSGSSSGEDDEGKEKPEAQQETPVDETPQS